LRATCSISAFLLPEFHETGDELGRQVVDAVVAEILEEAADDGLPRPGQSRHDEESVVFPQGAHGINSRQGLVEPLHHLGRRVIAFFPQQMDLAGDFDQGGDVSSRRHGDENLRHPFTQDDLVLGQFQPQAVQFQAGPPLLEPDDRPIRDRGDGRGRRFPVDDPQPADLREAPAEGLSDTCRGRSSDPDTRF
jgi:hypothetical protein